MIAEPPLLHVRHAPRRASSMPPLVGEALGLLLLCCAGLVSLLGWTIVWALSYRLTHGNGFTYTLLTTYTPLWERLWDLLQLANTLAPGIEEPRDLDILVNTATAGFVLAGLGYIGGLILLDRGLGTLKGAPVVVLAYALAMQALLFVMPGLYTTDVFSYVMYGHIAGVYGLNPHVYPPIAFPGNPMVEWIHPIWHGTPSVYGPLWTAVGWVMGRLGEPLGAMEKVYSYKALMNVVYLINLGLVWWLLGQARLEGGSARARVTAFALFAWNPVMVFEVAGNAHNDGLMVTLLLLSLAPLVGRTVAVRDRAGSFARWTAALVCVALSTLVKYTTGIVGVFYVVAWAARLPGWRMRVANVGAAGLVCLALAGALLAPWLHPDLLAPMLEAAGGKHYTNSLPDLAALTVADQVLDPARMDPWTAHEQARWWMKLITRALFALYLVWEVRGVWRRAAAGAPVLETVLAASVRAFLVLLLGVLTWVLAWYFTWPLALATLLGWRRTLTRVVVGFTVTSLPVFYIHHYWNVFMPGWLLFVYAVPPLLLPLGEWVWRRAVAAPRPMAPNGRAGVGIAARQPADVH